MDSAQRLACKGRIRGVEKGQAGSWVPSELMAEILALEGVYEVCCATFWSLP